LTWCTQLDTTFRWSLFDLVACIQIRHNHLISSCVSVSSFPCSITNMAWHFLFERPIRVDSFFRNNQHTMLMTWFIYIYIYIYMHMPHNMSVRIDNTTIILEEHPGVWAWVSDHRQPPRQETYLVTQLCYFSHMNFLIY
jgi:hypothetical protein